VQCWLQPRKIVRQLPQSADLMILLTMDVFHRI
jgi:hypothetical protein